MVCRREPCHLKIPTTLDLEEIFLYRDSNAVARARFEKGCTE